MRVCIVPTCEKKHKGHGYCSTHLYRFKTHGDAGTIAVEQHGMTKTDEYRIWGRIKNRCNDPNSTDYYLYGARGIHMSQEWDTSFLAFYCDMGHRPSKEHSIDRMDNRLGYNKGNCRWATRIEQANNKTNNILATIGGETRTLKQWVDKLGLKYNTIQMRVQRGSTPEKALGF